MLVTHLVGVDDGGEAVRDDQEGGLPARQDALVDGLLDDRVCFEVD